MRRLSMHLGTPSMVRRRTRPVRPRRAGAAAAVLAGLLGAAAVQAQSYPQKPVRVVVPYPPGSTDLVVRAIAAKLDPIWKQSMVIENKGGASAIIGTDFVAKAAPDGYTLLATTDSPITSNPFLFKQLPYDPIKDLVPVTQLLASNMIIVANPSFAAKDLKSLVELAKSRPGKLTYASWGSGSQAYLVFETLKRQAGLDVVEVPYKGLVPATLAAIAGEVDFTLSTPAVTMGHLEAGKLKPIAITYKVALPALAAIPSFADSGYPSIDPGAWMGLFAPAGTPPAVVRKIQQDVARVLADPAVRAREIEDKGAIAGGMGPDAFAAFVKADFQGKGDKYRLLGIQPQ